MARGFSVAAGPATGTGPVTGTGPGAGTLTAAEAVRAERARILAELAADVDRLAAVAVGTMRAEIPAYAALDEEFHTDVRDQVARHYHSKLAVLLADRTVTPEDVAFTRRAARRRARAGVALADYINAFRVGQQVFWESVLERAGRSPAGHDAALSLAGPLMRYCDFASTHAANAYMEFQQYAAAEAVREGRDLLETLLAGETPARGRRLAAARAHGLAPGGRTPLLVVVAVLSPRFPGSCGQAARSGPDPGSSWSGPGIGSCGQAVPSGPDRGADARHATCAAIARAWGNGVRTLAVVRQAEIVAVPVLGPGGDPGELCDRLAAVRENLLCEEIALAVGVSTVVSGPSRIPQAYREARTALEFLPEGGGVAALPMVTPFQYLALRADETARRLVDPRVSALLAEDRVRGGGLTDTIRAFAAADLNLRAAAERMRIHPNTAHYRLRRIRERTGRDLRRIDDLVDLLVAIALHDPPPPQRETAVRRG
ncbi:PucR family transcriptional regulator [Planomonospora corallina]|uniref:PucR family transcriptional regulator n=1 Tax=Planomonospora corallina TaxID=1806052 RepID=A0ABV8HZX0_9ACTN